MVQTQTNFHSKQTTPKTKVDLSYLGVKCLNDVIYFNFPNLFLQKLFHKIEQKNLGMQQAKGGHFQDNFTQFLRYCLVLLKTNENVCGKRLLMRSQKKKLGSSFFVEGFDSVEVVLSFIVSWDIKIFFYAIEKQQKIHIL